MIRLFILLVFSFFSLNCFAQKDSLQVDSLQKDTLQRVSQVLITDSSNNKIPVPMLGEKHLLIFYPDPERASQNAHLTDYLEDNPIKSDNIYAFGIVNLKDAPLYPNSLVRFIARQKIKKTGAQIFFDPNHAIKDGWNLGEVNNTFTIMFITKDSEIVFLKRGRMSDADVEEFYRVIEKYK